MKRRSSTERLADALTLWMGNAWRAYNDPAVSETERASIYATVLHFAGVVGEDVLEDLADALHLIADERERFTQLGPRSLFDDPPVPGFVPTEEVTQRIETTP